MIKLKVSDFNKIYGFSGIIFIWYKKIKNVDDLPKIFTEHFCQYLMGDMIWKKDRQKNLTLFCPEGRIIISKTRLKMLESI